MSFSSILNDVRRELAQRHEYKYEVINRDVPQAVREICNLLIRHAQESAQE